MARLATSPTRYQRRPTIRPELNAIVHRTRALTDASGAAVGLMVNNGQEIECCVSSGPTAPALGRSPLREESLTALCISCGKQLRLDKARTSGGEGAVVVTPVGRENQIIGVLTVFADSTDLFSEACLASLWAVAGQITEILWDEGGPRQDWILSLDPTDANAGQVGQPKPPASVGLPLAPKMTEPPHPEPQATPAKPEDRKPVQILFPTLEALAAQPERSAIRKTIWIAAVALAVIGVGAIWAFRAKASPADTQSVVSAGLRTSEARSAGVPASLSVGPASVTVRPGSKFALNIVLSRGQDVSSVPVLIKYDPLIMRVISVASGEFLSRDGQPVVLAHRDDSSTGTLRIHAQRLQGSPGLAGEGTVFRLVFVAMERGSGTVSIVSESSRDNQAANKPQTVSQAVVTVN